MLTEYRKFPRWYCLAGFKGPAGYILPWDTLSWWYSLCDNFTPIYDLRGDLGHPVESQEDVQEWQGLLPDTNTHVPQGFREWFGYLKNAKSFFSDWNFQSPGKDKSMTEKPVSHFNLFGTCQSGVIEQLGRFTVGLDGLYVDPPGCLNGYRVNTGADPIAIVQENYADNSVPQGNLLRLLPWLKETTNSGGFDYVSGAVYVKYSDFRYLANDSTVLYISYVIYRYDPSSYSPQVFYDAHCITWQYGFSRVPQTVTDGVWYNLNVVAPYTIVEQSHTYEYGLHSTPWTPSFSVPFLPAFSGSYSNWVLGGSPIITIGTTHFPHEDADSSGLSDTVGYDPFWGYQSMDQSFLDFTRFARSIRPDCYPGNVLSCQDGLDSYFNILETNHLETIAEYKSLFGVLDVLRLMREVKSSYKLRSLPLLLGCLSLLASAKLAYSFMLAPTVSDSLEISRRASRLKTVFNTSRYFGDHIVRGGYELELPADLAGDFVGTRLYCRSKVHVSIPSDSVLPYLMPIRSLGLLPSLSNVWDLIPFSFAIDWFLGIGTGLETIDTQVLFLCMDILSSTNSIELSWNFPDELQEEQEFAVTSEGPHGLTAGYKYYDRYIFNGVPPVAPTRLPLFTGGAGIPDWNLAASLLYKIIYRG